MDTKSFIFLVREMREHQKAFFKARTSGMSAVANVHLNKSKQLEKEVDQALAEGIGEEQKSYQTKIEL